MPNMLKSYDDCLSTLPIYVSINPIEIVKDIPIKSCLTDLKVR